MTGREDDLPAEFDPAIYRAHHADLAAIDDTALLEHFTRYGRDEGRISSVASTREGFIAEVIAAEEGRVIEVGPHDRPICTARNVRYLDAWTSDHIRRHPSPGDDEGRAVPRIDYVGTLDAAPRSFDAAVACRSIGHHPDLIGHLQSIARVLIEHGRYYLIVPDHRYTSAALLPPSDIGAVIAAHREGRTRHTIGSVLADGALRVDGDVAARWAGPPAPLPFETRARRIEAVLGELDTARGYVDAEAWHFTPQSFRDLFAMLCRLGLSSFVPVRVWTTPHLRDEFCAVLEKQV